MWESIKKILQDTGKALIIEDGKPKYVIMPIDEYLSACHVQADMKSQNYSSGGLTQPEVNQPSALVNPGSARNLDLPSSAPVNTNNNPPMPQSEPNLDINTELSSIIQNKNETLTNAPIDNNPLSSEDNEINLEDLPF